MGGALANRCLAPAKIRPKRLGQFNLAPGRGRLRFGVSLVHDPDVRPPAQGVKHPPEGLWLPAAANPRYSARLRRRSSVVERILGKAEVVGSIPPGGTIPGGSGLLRALLTSSTSASGSFNPGNIDVGVGDAHADRMEYANTFTAFDVAKCIGHGDLAVAARAAECAAPRVIVILSDLTGETVELDLRGGAAAAVAEFERRQSPPAVLPKARGRPKLGVIAREVTLLPRHWHWLATQRGGASAALRRLVEASSRANSDADSARFAQGALYRAMSTLAGDMPGYEEACRALFAARATDLKAIFETWPTDIAAYLSRLAESARAEHS